MPLYYPEEIIDGQENLFRVLLGLVASNKIKVYEYLDGREIFTEEYEVKVEDMLERFHILYEVKAGRTAKRNTYIIEESDVPCNRKFCRITSRRNGYSTNVPRPAIPSSKQSVRCCTAWATSAGKQCVTPCFGPIRRYTSLLGTALYHYR